MAKKGSYLPDETFYIKKSFLIFEKKNEFTYDLALTSGYGVIFGARVT